MAPWSAMLPASLYDPTAPSPFPALTRAVNSSSIPSDDGASAALPHNSTLAQKFMQGGGGRLMLPSASEKGGKQPIELYSGEFYAACTVGGILSCGLTHTAVTPLDVVKCNLQASCGPDPA